MPVSVVEGERSFSVHQRVKNYLESTMVQDRMNVLATLSIKSAKSNLARKMDFTKTIQDFAAFKTRRFS